MGWEKKTHVESTAVTGIRRSPLPAAAISLDLLRSTDNYKQKMDVSTPERESSSFLQEFYVPDFVLAPNAKKVVNYSRIPAFPVLVFINSKSGGQLGGLLLQTYRSLLNENQVFDLGEDAPDKVLMRVYSHLEWLKFSGNEFASKIQERLKLIVAGGDGTASWLLGVVCDLKLSHPPPIATVPLGTGNNLPFAFGWGRKNPGTDRQAVLSFLNHVKKAKEMKIDNWHVLMRMRAPSEGSCDPVAPLELPHSLHAFQRVSSTDELNREGHHTFRGGFWNYFSLGMDAQVSYAFHSERKLHPEKFKNQLVNQSTYAKLGCTQGWFCAALSQPASSLKPRFFPSSGQSSVLTPTTGHPTLVVEEITKKLDCEDITSVSMIVQVPHGEDERNISQLAKVKIMKKHGQWQDLSIPASIRSIVCLNLPSFSGGLNPWGTPNSRKQRERDLTPPYVDDGLVEVVGFRDAWHGLILLAPKGHGTRLAQAHRICFEFHREKEAVDHTYMRMDGEPWKQPIPTKDGTVVVEISHHGQVPILATRDCRARSIHETVSSHCGGEEDDSKDEDLVNDGEECRKFGAASSFKIPEEGKGKKGWARALVPWIRHGFKDQRKR